MKLCVIGTGYVGLVAGTCFAEGGHTVACVDIDRRKIESLNRGVIPIYEPGLKEILDYNVREKRLSFTTDLAAAVRRSQVVFLAVGTPMGKDGSADLTYLLQAAGSVGKALNAYKIIVNKSTAPVGTVERIRTAVKQHTRRNFDVASNPEFLKEGAAVEDFLKPDRIIVGTDSQRVAKVMQEIYAPFNRTRPRLMLMGIRSAEMTKYASNAMLATKISFINEVANFCKVIGADVNEVRAGMGADSRIGHQFLFPGMGYGGSCFPKDVQALIRTGNEHKFDFRILKAIEKVNRDQKRLFLPEIERHFKNNLKGRTIAVWGLAFKPKTDDMREAPSIVIIRELLKRGAKIQAHDPVAMDEAKKTFGNKISYCRRNYDALKNAEALIVVTEWNEFRRPDFPQMKQLMKRAVIFDGRNIYNPELAEKYGFTYYCVGRKTL